jgi:hypothetical protein
MDGGLGLGLGLELGLGLGLGLDLVLILELKLEDGRVGSEVHERVETIDKVTKRLTARVSISIFFLLILHRVSSFNVFWPSLCGLVLPLSFGRMSVGWKWIVGWKTRMWALI